MWAVLSSGIPAGLLYDKSLLVDPQLRSSCEIGHSLNFHSQTRGGKFLHQDTNLRACRQWILPTMNALQVFQQNFNLDNDAATKLAESNTIQSTEDETTVATPITQVNTTITTTQVSTTAEVLPEVTTAVKVEVATTTTEKIKPSSNSVTTTTSTIRQRTQKRLTNSKCKTDYHQGSVFSTQ